MKKIIALLCFALATGAASAAPADTNSGAMCSQLSADIAAQSALFARVAGTAPVLTELAPSAPAAERQRGHDKEMVLHTIANEIWSLRTRMAYVGCTQAKAFAY